MLEYVLLESGSRCLKVQEDCFSCGLDLVVCVCGVCVCAEIDMWKHFSLETYAKCYLKDTPHLPFQPHMLIASVPLPQ